MRVKVLFFGMLKDFTGISSEEIDLAEGATLGDLFAHYAAAYPRIQEYDRSIVLARNQEFSPRSASIESGDEIAFMPPVSGGSGPFLHEITDEDGNFFALTRVEVEIAEIKRRILQGRDGALTVFDGVVRNNTKGRPTQYLEYECYEAMAIKMMAEIGAAIAADQEISRIAMVHRLGRMEIGETSVAIAVTAPHRKPSFAAALEGINRLKRLVPIWKKEFFADGEVWTDWDWDDQVLNR